MECIHCHRRIGRSYIDRRSFNDLKNDERRNRPNDFYLTEVFGPHVLLCFNYNGRRYYLFGEDHEAQDDYNGSTLYSKVRTGDIIEFGGDSTNAIYIERFIFLMLSQKNTQIYLEVVPKSDKRQSPYWAHLDITQEIGKEHLSELYQMFNEPIEFGILGELGKQGINIFPVDYRNNNKNKGIYRFMSDSVCHYSLYEKLFITGRHDWIQELFLTDRDSNWQWDLMRITLFETNKPLFKTYSLAFKSRFDALLERSREHIGHLAYLDNIMDIDNITDPAILRDLKARDDVKNLEFFANIPGVVDPSRSYDSNGVSIQAGLLAQVPKIYSAFMYRECERACNRMAPENLIDMKEFIEEMHLWYMDIPAMSRMLTDEAPPNSNIFGYFGSAHVINMMKMVTHIDNRFTFLANGTNSIELTTQLRKEFNDLL